MNWSVILQSPEVRKIVQENFLTREFEDALYPELLFRADIEAKGWPSPGDNFIDSGAGLIRPKQKPLQPKQDPTPSSYEFEQWGGEMRPYGDTIDTHMPTSAMACSQLLMRDFKNIGLSAALALNGVIRNKLYNTALAGHTVANGQQTSVTTVAVKSLSGLTKARNPTLAGGSTVRFDPVSSANPLTIQVFDTNAADFVTRKVTSFTPDNEGDEVGPGTIDITGGAVTVADRAAIRSVDRSYLVRVGGGLTPDAINASHVFTLAHIREATTRLANNHAPKHDDGKFHLHMDPTSKAQLFGDNEFQRLFISRGIEGPYKNSVIGEILNCLIFENTQCPQPSSWEGNVDSTFAGQAFTMDDPFGGEVYNADGVEIHRPLFSGRESIKEYWWDGDGGMAPAAMRIAQVQNGASIQNNNITVMVDRIRIITRPPMDRNQEVVSTTWNFKGDHVMRTDSTAQSKLPERFKRIIAVEHGA